MAADENLSDEVPEADAFEQRQEAFDADVADDEAPSDREAEPSVDDSFEVPEADALEQSRVVPSDDEPVPEGD